MKIAFFHELPIGGAQRAIYSLGEVLKTRNSVDLYTTGTRQDMNAKKFFSNVFFYRFSEKKWNGNDWRTRIYKDTWELYKNYKLHKKIAQDIDKKKYDVVVINGSKFIESPFILQFLKTKKVFYCHDPYYRLIYDPLCEIPKNLKWERKLYEQTNRTFRKMLDKWNFSKNDLILTNSKFAQNLTKKTYGKTARVCYLGVDVNFFTPGKRKKLYDLLFIGSMSPIDGYDLFSEIKKKLDSKIVIKTVLIENEWLDKQQIRDIYRKSKVVLCLARHEPFGLVPLEAMACESIVVAVDEAGYKESIKDNRTGFLVQSSADKLVKKIRSTLKNYESKSHIGKIARQEVIQNWSWEKSGENLEKILRQYIKK